MIIKYKTYLIFAIFVLSLVQIITSCKSKQDQQYTPWGTPINADGSVPHGDSLHTAFSLDDIIAHGEMIMLTMTGPDTYYDYHGHGMGKQYLLCESFTAQLGVKLRVEVCRDTTEMVSKLERGEGDIIVLDKPLSTLDSRLSTLDSRLNWYVNPKNTTLADTLNHWYKPEMLAKVQTKMNTMLANGGVTRRVYSPMLNKAKGVISNYDGYFQKYAPMAGLDWKLVAAMCYQESCFDPKAHSWAGACGLMQIMPSTGTHLGLTSETIYNPEDNIAAGVKYMRELISAFSKVGSPLDRMAFALASYNGGPQHIYDAMALARKNGGSGQRWTEVRQYILKLMQPQYYNDPVVKHGYMRGTETVDYVEKILARWAQYRGYAVTPSNVASFSPRDGNATPRPSSRKNRFTK